MRRLVLFLVAPLVLAACTATGGSLSSLFGDERASYVEDNGLTGKDSVHVAQGRIYRGMPIDHALAALGPPRHRDTLATPSGGVRVEYLYTARANAFDPGNLPRAYVYAQDRAVADWENLDRIPRFDAYYEGGM